jgi:hypothetical protein
MPLSHFTVCTYEDNSNEIFNATSTWLPYQYYRGNGIRNYSQECYINDVIFIKVHTHTHTHTDNRGVGKSRFTVVSTRNAEFIIVLLFIC